MNPFDEQLQHIDDTAEAAENALKLKKLFTWHDISKYEDAIESYTKQITDLQCKDPWNWPSFFCGFGLATAITIILSVIIHNN